MQLGKALFGESVILIKGVSYLSNAPLATSDQPVNDQRRFQVIKNYLLNKTAQRALVGTSLTAGISIHFETQEALTRFAPKTF